MTELERVLDANKGYAEGFDKGGLGLPPARPLAVLSCIDARLHPTKFLGLGIGDAHVLRNAGGRATDDAIRSLLISSWLLGTREFLVIHHTDCGMLAFTDQVLRDKIRDEAGVDTDMEFLAFSDLDQSVRDDVDRLVGTKGFPEGVSVAGLIYDTKTGTLRTVVEPKQVG